MPEPTVPYLVLADGYSIDGGVDQPTVAVVPHLVRWIDAFTFVNDAMGSRTASAVGPIASDAPWRFPADPKLFARKYRVEPAGADGTPVPTKGLKPGEYYTHARVTLTFEPASYNPLGEPAFQLDPDNPLTYCDVEIEGGGRFETIKAAGLEFDDGTPVLGDAAQVVVESRLVLTFPRIPFLPWRQLRSYIGKINSVAMFDCPIGTLLFEAPRIKFSPGPNGPQNRSVQLVFAEQTRDWNELPKANGVYAKVRKKGATSERIYAYTDFRPIFDFLK